MFKIRSDKADLLQLFGFLFLILIGCKEDEVPELKDDEEEVLVDSLFMNPILTSGPDPWVFQDGKVYYLTFTTGHNLTLLRTEEMSDLSNAYEQVIWTPPASGMNSKNIWAPELHRIGGKWYFYYAADDGNNANHRMWVLENESDSPFTGKWTDKGKVQLPEDKWAIDGSPFEHDGQLYFVWSGWEDNTDVRQDIYMAKMENPWTASGERVLLIKPELAWETNETSPTVTEGPQFLRKGDKMFIIYSAGACWTDGYSLGLLTANTALDPMDPAVWEKSPEPVFSQNPEGNAYGPGHNGFFKSADGIEDWLIYHANPFEGQGCGGSRSIRIQPFSWSDKGIPEFGEPHPLYTKLIRPSGEY